MADAEKNSRRNGVSNISFLSGSVEKWISKKEPVNVSALILDPPRGGISGKVVRFIAQHQPDKIVYVSCNPSTLARDLKLIIDEAKYSLRTIIPVDMFPHTYHVEAVALLHKA